MTCVFEGSPNDVIMAQHAKILRLLAGKGLVSSVASFHSLVTFVSLLFLFTSVLGPRMDFNFSFQTQLRINGLMQMDKYINMCGSRGGDRGSRPNHKNIGFLSNISPDPL